MIATNNSNFAFIHCNEMVLLYHKSTKHTLTLQCKLFVTYEKDNSHRKGYSVIAVVINESNPFI